jgi:hypothetical protein
VLRSHQRGTTTALLINTFVAASSSTRFKLLAGDGPSCGEVLPMLLLLLLPLLLLMLMMLLLLLMLQITPIFRRNRRTLITDPTGTRLLLLLLLLMMLLLSVVLMMSIRRHVHRSLTAHPSLARLLRCHRRKRLHRRAVRCCSVLNLVRAAWPLAIERHMHCLRLGQPVGWSLRGEWSRNLVLSTGERRSGKQRRISAVYTIVYKEWG